MSAVEVYSGLPPGAGTTGETTTAFNFSFAGAPTNLTSTLLRPLTAARAASATMPEMKASGSANVRGSACVVGEVKFFLLMAGSDGCRGLRLYGGAARRGRVSEGMMVWLW